MSNILLHLVFIEVSKKQPNQMPEILVPTSYTLYRLWSFKITNDEAKQYQRELTFSHNCFFLFY